MIVYFLALIPATILAVAGYVALYLSKRSEGRMRGVGQGLGCWAVVLAALVMLGAVFAAARDGHRHSGFHGWRDCPPRGSPPPSAERPAPDSAPGAPTAKPEASPAATQPEASSSNDGK